MPGLFLLHGDLPQQLDRGICAPSALGLSYLEFDLLSQGVRILAKR